MHFINLFVFSRIRIRSRGRLRIAPPPLVAPDAVLPVVTPSAVTGSES